MPLESKYKDITPLNVVTRARAKAGEQQTKPKPRSRTPNPANRVARFGPRPPPKPRSKSEETPRKEISPTKLSFSSGTTSTDPSDRPANPPLSTTNLNTILTTSTDNLSSGLVGHLIQNTTKERKTTETLSLSEQLNRLQEVAEASKAPSHKPTQPILEISPLSEHTIITTSPVSIASSYEQLPVTRDREPAELSQDPSSLAAKSGIWASTVTDLVSYINKPAPPTSAGQSSKSLGKVTFADQTVVKSQDYQTSHQHYNQRSVPQFATQPGNQSTSTDQDKTITGLDGFSRNTSFVSLLSESTNSSGNETTADKLPEDWVDAWVDSTAIPRQPSKPSFTWDHLTSKSNSFLTRSTDKPLFFENPLCEDRSQKSETKPNYLKRDLVSTTASAFAGKTSYELIPPATESGREHISLAGRQQQTRYKGPVRDTDNHTVAKTSIKTEITDTPNPNQNQDIKPSIPSTKKESIGKMSRKFTMSSPPPERRSGSTDSSMSDDETGDNESYLQLFNPHALQKVSLPNSVSPECFKGTDKEDAKIWWSNFCRYAILKGLSDSAALATLPLFLKESASIWFDSLSDEKKKTLKLVHKAFAKRYFLDESLKWVWLDKFNSRTQSTNEKASDYAQEMVKLGRDLKKNDIETMEGMVRGLKPQIRNYVMEHDPKSLDEALHHAKMAEAFRNESTKTEEGIAELTKQLSALKAQITNELGAIKVAAVATKYTAPPTPNWTQPTNDSRFADRNYNQVPGNKPYQRGNGMAQQRWQPRPQTTHKPQYHQRFKPCRSCGDTTHDRMDCRFKSYQCHHCHKIGHLSKVCNSLLNTNNAK